MNCPHCGAPVVDVTSKDSREQEVRYSPDAAIQDTQDFIAKSIMAGRGSVYEAIVLKFGIQSRQVR